MVNLWRPDDYEGQQKFVIVSNATTILLLFHFNFHLF